MVESSNVIHFLCCGGLGRSMFCCGGLGISVYQNFWIKNRSSSLLSRPKLPREIEYNFLAGVSDFLALSTVVIIFSVPWRWYVWTLHSLCLNKLHRGSLSDSTLPSGSCFGNLSM